MILLFFIIVIVVINFLIAYQFYEIAEMKGYSEIKYFWIAFLFSITGYLLVIALPDKNQREVRVTKDKTNDESSEQVINYENDELPDL